MARTRGRFVKSEVRVFTQSSFVGHVGMTLLMAHLLAAFLSHFENKAKQHQPLYRRSRNSGAGITGTHQR